MPLSNLNLEHDMNRRTVLSIVMATRNSEKHVSEALESLKTQSRPPDEIVVVDCVSSDRTREIVNQFDHVKLIEQRSKGFQNAWNEGICQATGNIIGFLDSDDRLRADALESSLRLLDRRNDIDAVFGQVEFFCDEDSWPASFRTELKTGSHQADIPGCMIARKSVFDEVGLFPEDWQILADVVWFADLRQSGVAVIRNPLTVLEKRVRSDGLSITATSQNIYRAELLRMARRQVHANSANENA